MLELLLFYSRLQGDVNPWPTACWRPLAPCPAFWTPPPPTWPRSPAWENTVVLLKLIPCRCRPVPASRNQRPT
ncbi:MAG: hypothetical protein ACLT9P_02395 [Evtepia gabavorous]